MPMDEKEKDRMDLQHHKYKLIMGGRHFLAPINPNPQRILDLGTGTGGTNDPLCHGHPDSRTLGIWALDIADTYPTAEVGDTCFSATENH